MKTLFVQELKELCSVKRCTIHSIRINREQTCLYVVDGTCGLVHRMPLFPSERVSMKETLWSRSFDKASDVAFPENDLLLVASCRNKHVLLFSEAHDKIVSTINLERHPLKIHMIDKNNFAMFSYTGDEQRTYFLEGYTLDGGKIFEQHIPTEKEEAGPGLVVSPDHQIYLAPAFMDRYVIMKFNNHGKPVCTFERKMNPILAAKPTQRFQYTDSTGWVEVKGPKPPTEGTPMAYSLALEPQEQKLFTIVGGRYVDVFDLSLNFQGLLEIPFGSGLNMKLAVCGKTIYSVFSQSKIGLSLYGAFLYEAKEERVLLEHPPHDFYGFLFESLQGERYTEHE